MASSITKLLTRDVIVTIRARAFTGSAVDTHRCMVSPDGAVRVFDDIGAYYTLLHVLSPRAVRKARKAAAERFAEEVA